MILLSLGMTQSLAPAVRHLQSSQSRFSSEKKVSALEAAAITLPFQTDLFVSLLRVISLVVRIKS